MGTRQKMLRAAEMRSFSLFLEGAVPLFFR